MTIAVMRKGETMRRPIDAEDRQKPQALIVRENRNNSDAYHLYCPICKWPVGTRYVRNCMTSMYNTDENVCPHCGQVFDLEKTKQEAFEAWNRRAKDEQSD